ncbi:MAG: pilus assembly PilX N-terminal domain-containing protein [Candidatus Eremiobacteraeota bacterium]|nr:pilus assembly PilX N-terminal domain-containing protein [Candidatus Eremiobacteraeota bacterium]
MKKKWQGVVLITTMLLLSFIIMIATLLVVTGRNSMKLGASYRDRENAFFAAESGIAYAQRMLRTNKNWTTQEVYVNDAATYPYADGDSTGKLVVTKISTGSFAGIKGVIDGGSEFYIAFGPGSSAPSSPVPYDASQVSGPFIRYYSTNHFTTGLTSSHYSYAYTGGTWRPFREVPAGYTHVIVEGRCGSVARYVEVFLQKDFSSVIDSAFIVGQDLDVDLQGSQYKFWVNDKYGQGVNVRSMNTVNVHIGNSAVSGGNYIYRVDGGSSITCNNTYVNKGQVTAGLNYYNSAFWNYGVKAQSVNSTTQAERMNSIRSDINWDKFSNSYLSGNSWKSSVNDFLLAGSYMYLESKTTPGTYNLAYVPYQPPVNATTNELEYSQLFEKLNNNSLTPVYYDSANWQYNGVNIYNGDSKHLIVYNDSKGGEYESSKMSKIDYLVKINDAPVGVASTQIDGADAYGFYTLAANYSSAAGGYTFSDTTRPKVGLVDDTKTEDVSPSLITIGDSSVKGSIVVEGEISGSGSILSSGNLVFQGESQLQPGSASGLAMYSKSDIRIKEISGGDVEADAINSAIKTSWAAYSKYCNQQYNIGIGNTKDTLATITKWLSDTKMNSDPNFFTSGGNYSFTLPSGNSYNCNGKSVIDYLKACEFSDTEAKELVKSFLQKNYSDAYTESTWGLSTHYYRLTQSGFRDLSFSDCVIKGVIVSERDLRVTSGGGALKVQGFLVTYGTDPMSSNPPGSQGGNLTIADSKDVSFTYDPDYLQTLFQGLSGINTKRAFWSTWTQ